MKNMSVLVFFMLCFFSSHAAALAQSDKKQSLERQIRTLDLAEAEAILKKDYKALDELSAADFTTNSPRNTIVRGKDELKELMRTGVVDYASFTREVEAVLIYEKTVVTMGSETIVMGDGSPQKGQSIRRRYTNIWMNRNGKWLLTARHANVIPPVTPVSSPAGPEQVVREFFQAFNLHQFEIIPDITTEDWNHIDPSGGSTKGREAVLNELKAVHSTFLKGVTMQIENLSVRFTAADAAIVTVTNSISSYTTPDGVKHENERQIKTFLVVNRDGKWRIAHDQNTIIAQTPKF